MTQPSDGIEFTRDGVDPSQWPKLSCSQANQLALESSDLRLDAEKKILFQGKGEIGSLGDIRFLTGNSSTMERLRILANGNVGIGIETRQPSAKLEVAGTLKLETGEAVNEFSLAFGDGNRNTAVPTETAVKAYFESQISPLNQALSLKAGTTQVEQKLSVKADTTWVQQQLSVKADTTQVEQKLSVKADTTWVQQQLSVKADTTQVEQKLSVKADTTWVQQQLSVKADKSQLVDRIYLNANSSYDSQSVGRIPNTYVQVVKLSQVTTASTPGLWNSNLSAFVAPRDGVYAVFATVTFNAGNGKGDGVIMGFSVNEKDPWPEEGLSVTNLLVIEPGKFVLPTAQSISALLTLRKNNTVQVALAGVDNATFYVSYSSLVVTSV